MPTQKNMATNVQIETETETGIGFKCNKCGIILTTLINHKIHTKMHTDKPWALVTIMTATSITDLNTLSCSATFESIVDKLTDDNITEEITDI